MEMEYCVVYEFPNGFQTQGEMTFKSLRHCGLNPKWAAFTDGIYPLMLPAYQADCLIKLARLTPARYGNAETIEKTMKKYGVLK